MTASREDLESTIRQTSVIELSLVIAAAGALVGGTVWATKISLGQDAVQADVTEVRLLLETWEDEIWFESDMQRWIDLSNRELRRMHQELGEEGAAHDPDRWMFLPDTSEVR